MTPEEIAAREREIIQANESAVDYGFYESAGRPEPGGTRMPSAAEMSAGALPPAPPGEAPRLAGQRITPDSTVPRGSLPKILRRGKLGQGGFWDPITHDQAMSALAEEFKGRPQTMLKAAMAEVDKHYKDVLKANKTARAAGAVGEKAITPRYVEATAKKGDTILDFGSARRRCIRRP